ncbi:hypothetical protein [Ulvibacterium sp.]|nr:hypothetical protein [Ulvibacterium sp.]
MEKIYSKHEKDYRIVKACASTVKFLLDYSKALHVVKHKELTFESILN